MRTCPVAAIALLGFGLTGCVTHAARVQPQKEMTPAENSFDNFWEASKFVLRENRFTIDVENRRAGRISTEPLTGKQFFEFWRHDAVSGTDVRESSVQTIYRIAIVTIAPGATPDEYYKPSVVVNVGRSNRGETSIATLSDAYRLPFADPPSRRLPEAEDPVALDAAVKKAAETGQYVRPVSPEWLTALGRDENLEKKLLGEIFEAARTRGYLRKLELPWP